MRVPAFVGNAIDRHSRLAYDPAARRLEVEFVSGRRYAYLDVPESEAEAMRRVTSKGSFFNRHIRDRYRFVRQRA